MFNNLIESSSHAQEFKRRGSFLLFTTVTYALVLLITGVVSIYAYDAHLSQQNLDLEVTLLTPDTLPSEPGPPAHAPGPNRPAPVNATIDHQPTVASVNTPQVTPAEISTTANPPLPPAGGPGLSRFDPNAIGFGPGGPGGPGVGIGNGSGRVIHVEIPDDPPPVPSPTPAVPKILRISKVINNQAISLPKPIYPPIAKQTRTQGIVNVQVLIDERGNVISAKAVSGHPFLIPEAQRAALQAKFSPAFIGEQPVKVSGVISYNFLLSN